MDEPARDAIETMGRVERLSAWLVEGEAWLMDRILFYASRQGYTAYTSSLREAWRASICGLTEPLVGALRASPNIPELTPDDPMAPDPMSAFGVLEAQRHRARGVTLPMFLGLMKYYRQAYQELVREGPLEGEDAAWAALWVERFFDRVEIAFCGEWAALSGQEALRELQEQNRKLINDKARYLTIFESLPSPCLFVDDQGKLQNANAAAARLLVGTCEPGGVYHGGPDLDALTELLAEPIMEFVAEGEAIALIPGIILPTMSGERVFDVQLNRMLDYSQKYLGTTVTLLDTTEETETKQAFLKQNVFWRRLTDNMTELIGQFDEELRFTYASPSYWRVLGYQPDELKGTLLLDLFHEDERETARQSIFQMLSGAENAVQYRVRHKNGDSVWLEITGRGIYDDAEEERVGVILTGRDISTRQKLAERLRTLLRAVEQCPVSIVVTDTEGNIEYTNPWFSRVTGYSADEALGQNPRVLKSGELSSSAYQELWRAISAGGKWTGEFHNRRKDGSLFWERAHISAVVDPAGVVTHYIAVKEDITAQKQLEKERAFMEAELAHARKLEAVGQLAAGIAHEINTPTQFVSDNLHFLRDSFAELLGVVDEFVAERKARLGEADKAPSIDLDFLREEIPPAIEQSLEGTQRVAKIVRAMKEFSHPDGTEMSPTDINHAIVTTTTVARNAWKYVANLELSLSPTLPLVPAHVGELNQVFLNLIVNAADAIREKLGDHPVEKGTLTVTTEVVDDWVEVRIRDTGCGIPESHRSRVFDQFFTTKAPGKGTGQGLAIAYGVVTKVHRGTIQFSTEAGVGTTFIVRIPIQLPPPSQ